MFAYCKLIVVNCMDIINRLKLFINSNNIGSSEFADRCDIPRPTVSQLLNGRNKKVSNEIIDKIHYAYPNLSILWLMFGEGVMLSHSSSDNINIDLFSNSAENPIFDNVVDSAIENRNLKAEAAEIGVADNNRAVGTNINTCINNNNSTMDISALKATDADNSSMESFTESKRRIVNIMVFYSDNSFETFGGNS